MHVEPTPPDWRDVDRLAEELQAFSAALIQIGTQVACDEHGEYEEPVYGESEVAA